LAALADIRTNVISNTNEKVLFLQKSFHGEEFLRHPRLMGPKNIRGNERFLKEMTREPRSLSSQSGE
jgi:hypothetical protein